MRCHGNQHPIDVTRIQVSTYLSVEHSLEFSDVSKGANLCAFLMQHRV